MVFTGIKVLYFDATMKSKINAYTADEFQTRFHGNDFEMDLDAVVDAAIAKLA